MNCLAPLHGVEVELAPSALGWRVCGCPGQGYAELVSLPATMGGPEGVPEVTIPQDPKNPSACEPTASLHLRGVGVTMGTTKQSSVKAGRPF